MTSGLDLCVFMHSLVCSCCVQFKLLQANRFGNQGQPVQDVCSRKGPVVYSMLSDPYPCKDIRTGVMSNEANTSKCFASVGTNVLELALQLQESYFGATAA